MQPKLKAFLIVFLDLIINGNHVVAIKMNLLVLQLHGTVMVIKVLGSAVMVHMAKD